MKSAERSDFESSIKEQVTKAGIVEKCDECASMGLLRVDPYMEKVRAPICLTVLCDECFADRVRYT